ncbi:MAG: hypothetical protein ACXADY_02900 [Candidatus Hodarchaeales archaeon]|jgi:hypothetical protein
MNNEEINEEEIISSSESSDMTAKDDREMIRKLMTEGAFDRRTNIALNRMLVKDELLDKYGAGGSSLRNFVKGIVFGSQAEARDKLIKYQIRNENIKSVTLIVSIVGIIVTVVSIILALRF